jgi:hypothetical protein
VDERGSVPKKKVKTGMGATEQRNNPAQKA